MTRAGTVRVGDRVRFDGQIWDVGGLDAGTVYLTAHGRKPMAITLNALFADPTFEGRTGRRARGALPPTALFNELPTKVRERARWWEEHLTEVIDGIQCSASADALPRPEFDVTATSLRQREQAKVDELVAAGENVTLRKLQKRRIAYGTDGLLGVVDRRTVRARSVAGRTDPRVVDALQRVHAAAKPVIVPETIVFDHGKAYLSDTFRSACRTLGISIQPAHPDTPTDKPVVERTLQSVGTLFAQYVAGYLGSSVERRGKNAEQEAVFSLVELQDLLDEWIVTGWQNRPHDGLRDPLSPGQVLTPNEKYAAMLGVAGYVPVPLSGDDYIELLPMKPRAINSYGIKINHRIYDAEELNPYRGQPSGAAGMKDLWEVHHDPYDVTRVWVRDHYNPDGGWITLWWKQLASAPVPFGEDAWNHARKTIAERGQTSPSEEEIARLVDDLLRRADGEQPGGGAARRKTAKRTTRERRVAAKTAATTAAPRPLPQASPPSDLDPDPEESPAAQERSNADDGAADEQLAEVIPLGVYDPHKEAQQWW